LKASAYVGHFLLKEFVGEDELGLRCIVDTNLHVVDIHRIIHYCEGVVKGCIAPTKPFKAGDGRHLRIAINAFKHLKPHIECILRSNIKNGSVVPTNPTPILLGRNTADIHHPTLSVVQATHNGQEGKLVSLVCNGGETTVTGKVLTIALGIAAL